MSADIVRENFICRRMKMKEKKIWRLMVLVIATALLACGVTVGTNPPTL